VKAGGGKGREVRQRRCPLASLAQRPHHSPGRHAHRGEEKKKNCRGREEEVEQPRLEGSAQLPHRLIALRREKRGEKENVAGRREKRGKRLSIRRASKPPRVLRETRPPDQEEGRGGRKGGCFSSSIPIAFLQHYWLHQLEKKGREGEKGKEKGGGRKASHEPLSFSTPRRRRTKGRWKGKGGGEVSRESAVYPIFSSRVTEKRKGERERGGGRGGGSSPAASLSHNALMPETVKRGRGFF